MIERKDAQITISTAVLGVAVGVVALLFAMTVGFHIAALANAGAQIGRLSSDVGRLEKTVGRLEKTIDQNRQKMLLQQEEVDHLRQRILRLTAGPVPPPKPEPILLRGTSSQRDETQLEAIPFAGTGSLVMRASASQWAEDTSIGLQIWHPREDGVVFRGGYYRVVKNGNAVINEPIPGWDQLKRGEHTYEINWSPESLTLKVDGKRIATVPSGDLPARSTTFLIRFNADPNDVLTVHSYRGRYTEPSGTAVTVP